MRPMGKRNLNKDEIAAIRHRIATETAHELAECFDVHVKTILTHTWGMKRARRRNQRSPVTDDGLVALVSSMRQVDVARMLGVSPAAVCQRLRKIRKRGPLRYGEIVLHQRQDLGRTTNPQRVLIGG